MPRPPSGTLRQGICFAPPLLPVALEPRATPFDTSYSESPFYSLSIWNLSVHPL